MADYTETYENVLKQWSALCGLEFTDLLSTESALFSQFANRRLRYIWDLAEWPETIAVYEATLTNDAFEATSSMNLILGIFQENPLSYQAGGNTQFNFRRASDDVYVYGSSIPATVHVLYKARYPTFTSAAHTVPRRFGDFLAKGAHADWLFAENDPRAAQEEGAASELAFRELDKFERQEKHAQWATSFRPQPTPYYY